PNTIRLALQDNPVGQLTWLTEKFDLVHVVLLSDPAEEHTDSDIFTTASLFFLSEMFLSSMYIYAQNLNNFMIPSKRQAYTMLFSQYKWNVTYWPEEFVVKVRNLVVYKEHDKGGLDNPEGLIKDLREVYGYY
ncbi:hypothetical protein C8J56DRAFT_802564, partial [Mycena floridula]